jgi:hypothetical protein
VSGGFDYLNFSEDLSQRVIEVAGQALTSLPVGSEGLFNLFLRKADGSYSLLNTAAPSEFPAPGAQCYEFEFCFAEFDMAVFAGASQDFTHVIFEANDSLTGTGAPGGMVWNLYENAGGLLRVVGVLPDGEISPGGAVAGAGGPSLERAVWSQVNHAISADGTRVVFQAAADEGAPDPAQKGMPELYDRLEGAQTVEISEPAPGAKPTNPAPEPAKFWNASTDGSEVYFVSSAELTTESNTGVANEHEDLYRFNLPTGARNGELIDLTREFTADPEGAGVRGVVGASESATDGPYVYFVASGQLHGAGVTGAPNLYVWHEDPSTHAAQVSFIATLNEGDSLDWSAISAKRRAYVTPDGQHLAFMSLGSLTGYDNTDRISQGPDSQVYEFSASTGTLLCASCDPSGTPPVGPAYIGAPPSALARKPFHEPRVLSDDGTRLFFSSPDPLVAGVISPYAKIYEHELDEFGNCRTEGGCLAVISPHNSGAGHATDVFLDADKSGNNVFFATLSRLAPTDTDGLVDVYDARVGGGSAPPSAVASCTGCDGSTSGTLPSATPPSQLILPGVTAGSGDLAPPSTATKPKPKPTKPSCNAKAKKIKNAKARARALKRCPRPRPTTVNWRAGR